MKNETWSPEIEPETNPIDEVQFLMDNENMTHDEAVANLPEYKSIASGYIDFLIAQKESGVFQKPTKTNDR